jgi:xanthine dehydrogenase YagR molybdenum-binding subunit
MSVAAPQPKENMGQPIPRRDARAKVTGEARYGSDTRLRNPAYAYLFTSKISKGKIAGFDLADARKVPGVIEVFTYENMEKLKEPSYFGNGGYGSTKIAPLNSSQIYHDGQIVGVVVADSFEAAREASYLVKVTYDAQTPTATMSAAGSETVKAKGHTGQHTEDPEAGDFERFYGQGAVRVTTAYETPTQHHNPMELFATSCEWNGDRLTVYEPTQYLHGLKNGLAEQLDIDAEKIRVLNPYIGGAFGSKGSLNPRTAIIASLARRLNRPVKLVVTREQGFTTATYRAETRHVIKLDAAADGRFIALSHEGFELTSRTDDYAVGGTTTTTRLYNIPNVKSMVSIVRTDRSTPGFMRSPPEVPYIFALETAVDEMAEKLKMDPIELRRINDTQKELIKGNPYTSRSLMRCFDEAAAAFGWSKRNPKPASMTDGDWLIGWGCATSCYPSQMAPSAARVKFYRDGRARVEIAGHDIGTGAYTVIAQAAAERLDVPVEKVEVVMGDSDLPPAPVAGGSNSTASTCSAVITVCDQIRTKLFKALDPKESLIDKVKGTVGLGETANQTTAKSKVPVNREKAFDALGASVVEEYGEWKPDGAPIDSFRAMHKGHVRMVGGPMKDKIAFAFGAEFVEVRVNKYTKEIRVPRIVGAFGAAHIMNPRTARSQLMGGMIWGISSALHEVTEIDERNARYVNTNFADYLVPVNADVGEVEVIFVSENDDKLNPAGVKGIGELGNVGTNAAISNAVFHATGKRIRNLPIRVEDLLDA